MRAEKCSRLALCLPLCLLTFACFLSSCNGALFAVDLGSDFLKVSLVKPGKIPISIVVNEMSKRKSVSTVAIVDGDRYLANDAFALQKRNPGKVFNRLTSFLGKPADHDSVKKVLREGSDWKWPLNVLADEARGTVRFDLGNDESIAIEELVASILHYTKQIVQAQAGEEVVDCVIAVPAFFGPAQKQAILDAAKLTGLNVLTLVHSHSAAALQYGIERDFTEKPQDIILYDMGSNSVQVALVHFSAYETKERGKAKSVSQFQVKDVAWDDDLGGDQLDWILVEHFAKEFQEQYKLDLTTVPRAVAKMKHEVRRTKEVLSANTEAPVYIEGLMNDIDFKSKITRSEFEDLAGDFFERAKKPLVELVTRNELDVSKLDGVEMIGGGTRVKKLQAVLSEALGGRNLDRHLDADEAVVMGAGLVAANLSTTFRLRQFGLVDGAVYPVKLQLSEPENWTAPEGAEVDSLFKPKSLLPYMKRLPSRRVVHLPNFTADPFTFTLSYNVSDGQTLPPGVDEETYATFEISGAQKIIEKHGAPGKASLTFQADTGGVLSLEKAEYSVEVVVKPKEKKTDEKKEENEKNKTKGENLEEELPKDATEEENEEAEENGNGDEGEATEKVGEGEQEAGEVEGPNGVEKENATESNGKAANGKKAPKKKVLRELLTVSGPTLVHRGLNGDEVVASKKVMRAFLKREEEKRETEKAQNDLESYIYTWKEKLDSDEQVEKVTNEEQRSTFNTELSEIEDWLYMDGENEQAKEYRKRLRGLQKTGDAILMRIDEMEKRPEAVSAAQAYIELIKKAANAWPELKPYLNQTEIDKLLDQAKEFETWLKNKLEQQEALASHEDPAFQSMEVALKMTALEKPFRRLNNKRPPKPPPAPKAANTTENVTVNGTDNSDPKPDAKEDPKEDSMDQSGSEHDEL